ncbi:MAG: MASE3 domain-containing protein, partial [Candidatus Omnitrophota bacterium]
MKNTNTLDKKKSFYKQWFIWGILFIVPFLFYPWALNASWVSNSDVHSLLEFCAAIIALITAAVVLTHFFVTGRKFFLLISLGFTLQGAEDLVHAIYSFSRIWPTERIGILNFVPGTYVTGRLLLVFCFILAFYREKKGLVTKNRTKEAISYNTVGFFIAAIATLIIINSPLPKFILPGQIISRPVDFIAALIYLFSFLCFVKMYRQEKYHTPFVWSLTASLIFGFITQAYMIHSQQLYDAQFDISHLLKIFSYIFPIGGIAVGTFVMYKKEATLRKALDEKTTELIQEVSERKQAESDIGM